MSIAHHRRKQPERVRQQLLEVAARLSLEHGAAGATLDAVSQAAGVSKGGLLHHFPNKMALLEGLFDDLTGKLERTIAEEMRKDAVAHGRFTRAYLSCVFALQDEADAQGWQVLTIALLSEPQLRERWRQWVADRADEYVGTDSSAGCLLARLAADGLWLADILRSHEIDPATRQMMRAQLIDLSQQ
jgi:AcrR family transcriptional regulator